MNASVNVLDFEQQSSHRAWYLVYTKPKGEKTAQENLLRQGYETYLPLLGVSKRRRGRYITLIEPMFSRYLFIQLNQTSDNWSPIRSTLGVTDMVRFSGYPAKVPAELIEFLRASEYTSVDAKIMRKADGTGFFIMPSGAANLFPIGSYRLRLIFNRDLRETESIILSQAGDTNPEEATIDIPWETIELA